MLEPDNNLELKAFLAISQQQQSLQNNDQDLGQVTTTSDSNKDTASLNKGATFSSSYNVNYSYPYLEEKALLKYQTTARLNKYHLLEEDLDLVIENYSSHKDSTPKEITLNRPNHNKLAFHKKDKLIYLDGVKSRVPHFMQLLMDKEMMERVTKQAEKSYNAKIIRRLISKIFNWCALVCIIIVLIILFYNTFTKYLDRNSSSRFNIFDLNLNITGDFTTSKYIEQQLVEYRSFYNEPLGSYLNQDLSKIYNLLKLTPWIKELKITKQWESTLKIDIVDYTPIAAWNNQQNLYISDKSEIFAVNSEISSKGIEELSHLPLFIGKIENLNMIYRYYSKLKKLLKLAKLTVSKIDYVNDYQIEVYLSNGIKATFDLINEDNSFENLLIVLLKAPIPQGQQIQSIDLRYEQGAAIKFAPIQNISLF